MPRTSNHLKFICFLLLNCVGCVPLQQQISEREDSEIEGFVGPLVIDEEKFNHVASRSVYDRLNVDDQLLPSNNRVTYESTFGGKQVYIHNCKCMSDIKVIKNMLVLTHSYGGGESHRESTTLLWNGRHYQNSKGEYIADVMLYSDVVDIHRAMITEKQVFDIKGTQVKDVNFVLIHLIGKDGLIRYAY
jgi:hypothetical protein